MSVLDVGGDRVGRNSVHIKNSTLPCKISMIEHQGSIPLSVSFDVVAREGEFTDTTIAGYASRGEGSSLTKFLLNEGSKRLPAFFKGELTTQFTGISPKPLHFEIIFRADFDLPPSAIIDRVKVLQSLCYPRSFIGLNPPLCTLHVLNLYSLEVYVEQVLVSWHSQWNLNPNSSPRDYGLPMGCNISMAVRMHQYPTREEILCGAGFDSSKFTGMGYSGTRENGKLTLTHDNECVQDLISRNAQYTKDSAAQLAATKAAAEAKKAADAANAVPM